MKKNFFEEHKGIFKRVGCLILTAVIAGTGVVAYHNNVRTDVPELVTYVDPETTQVEEDEVPLASGTKTTRKVTTKTTTKKTTMATKAKKTSTTTKKTTKNTTKTTSSSSQQVKTNTTVATTVKTSTKKNSKVKTTQTKVVTTVVTITTKLKTKTTSSSAASSSAASSSSANTVQSAPAAAGTYNVRSVAPAADARVLNAFESIGCKVVVNPSVSYSGCFDARNRTITLKKLDSTIYHELGHFVEFVGGTTAVKNAIANAYNTEKSKYTASNKAYVLQSSSEYFAESFKNYCENPSALKQSRPNTYDAVVQALSVITDSRVNMLKGVYASVWS